MRICLLTNQDLDADPFVDEEPPCDPRPCLPEATWQVVTLKKSTAVEQVARLVSEGFDLFFNLCDGAADDGTTPGIEVVRTLFWLEINPNCGVYGTKEFGCSADLILLRDPAGHEGFTRQIVAAALARHARSRRTSALRQAAP